MTAARFPAGAISVDGVITSVAEARVAAMDHGFLFGDSVYEVVRTHRGRPVAFAEHLARLRGSAAAIYLQVPWNDEELVGHARSAFAATGLGDAYLRVVVTRGVGPMSLLPDECRSPSVLVYALPLRLATPEELERGISVAVADRLRNDARALDPAAKTGNYLNSALALVEARRAGADDAVLRNAAGEVTEATTANVFWVRGGEVRTPSLECGILAGITRTLVTWGLGEQQVYVREGRFPVSDLRAADEIFLTGTIRGVSAVVKLDGRPVGDGRPGPVTRRAMAVLEPALESHARPW